MAKGFHDRDSLLNALKRLEIICGEIRGVLAIIEEGKYTGRLLIEGEAELERSKKRLPIWAKHARGAALDAVTDPDEYSRMVERKYAESGDEEPDKKQPADGAVKKKRRAKKAE